LLATNFSQPEAVFVASLRKKLAAEMRGRNL